MKDTRVRTYLDPIRAQQLKEIATHYDYESIAIYLDEIIAKEWKELHSDTLPTIHGFEIYAGACPDTGIPIVFFAARGTTAIELTAEEAKQLYCGIDTVLSDEVKKFEISTIQSGGATIYFQKKGNGYRLVIKWASNEWVRGMSKSIAKDFSEVFRTYSEKSFSEWRARNDETN